MSTLVLTDYKNILAGTEAFRQKNGTKIIFIQRYQMLNIFAIEFPLTEITNDENDNRQIEIAKNNTFFEMFNSKLFVGI